MARCDGRYGAGPGANAAGAGRRRAIGRISIRLQGLWCIPPDDNPAKLLFRRCAEGGHRNDKGGYDGFNEHLRQVAERVPHIEAHPEIWLKTRPATSVSAHLFMKAVQLCDKESGMARTDSTASIFNQVLWAFRCAFFRDCRDIAHWDVQREIARGFGAISARSNNAFTMERLSPAWRRTTRTPTRCESKAARASC